MQRANFICCLVFFVFNISLAQKKQQKEPWRVELDSVFRESVSTLNFDLLEQYYTSQSTSLQEDTTFNRFYFSRRLNYFKEVKYRELKRMSPSNIKKNPDFIRYIDDINQVQKYCSDCYLCALVDKSRTLRRLNLNSELASTERSLLKKHGFKEDKEGVTFTAKYNYGNYQSFGVEFHAVGYHRLKYKLKKSSHMKCGNSKDKMMTFLTVGYNYFPELRQTQVYGSVINFVSPIYFRPIQIGAHYTETNSIFFYRPELGFGYKGFHMSGGYNVVFRKALRNDLDPWMLSLGHSYVFDK